MYLARQVLPAMRRNKRGRIVHTGSIAGEAVTAGATAYSVAKTGLRVFSDGLRREVRHLGIHSSTLEPGFTDDTDMPLEVSPRMKAYAKRAKEDSDFGDYSKFFTEKAIQDFEKLCYGETWLHFVTMLMLIFFSFRYHVSRFGGCRRRASRHWISTTPQRVLGVGPEVFDSDLPYSAVGALGYGSVKNLFN